MAERFIFVKALSQTLYRVYKGKEVPEESRNHCTLKNTSHSVVIPLSFIKKKRKKQPKEKKWESYQVISRTWSHTKSLKVFFQPSKCRLHYYAILPIFILFLSLTHSVTHLCPFLRLSPWLAFSSFEDFLQVTHLLMQC